MIALVAAALVLVVVYVASAPATAVHPAPTLAIAVAGRTDAPGTSTPPPSAASPAQEPPESAAALPEPSAEPSAAPSAEPSAEPSAPPTSPPTLPGVTAIVPGAVDRSSLDVTATYRVNAAITVGTGRLDVATRIIARNDSGKGIDRLELNTVAARLGDIELTATVDDVPVGVKVRDQTLLVPLGGILPDGASATILVTYRATLRDDVTGSDWMFSRAFDTVALYRWIPWVSRAVPFDRPNTGDPFVTSTSPQVDVELLTDERMVLAAPAAVIDDYAAGDGTAWSFTVRDVRDVSVVLAPDFEVARGKAKGVPIRAYTRPGGNSGPELVRMAEAAIEAEVDRLGVAYPWTTLVLVETEGGASIESPGLIWVTSRADTLNRTYAVYHGTAQQWFYGLVGNDQRADPFADEAPSDLLARTALGTQRASRCPRADLDRSISAYSRTCYYEVVFVQGGSVLDDIRERMGTNRFWRAMREYLEENRLGIGGTRELLETLRANSKVNLLPLLRSRFPDLY